MNKIEVVEGSECEYCGSAVFQRNPPTPEDLEYWECFECGKDDFLPHELDEVMLQEVE